MAFDAGAVLGRWILDAEGWVKGQKQIDKSNKSMMGGLKKVGKAVAGIGIAFSAIAVASIRTASDLEEAQNKFSVVFRGVEDSANAMRQNLVDNFGVSRLEATRMLSTMQDFLVPMGLARDSAAEFAGQFAQIAVDLGSFNKQPTAQVMADIQSAMSGMALPMRKYGVDISETTLKQMALDQGIKLVNGKIDRQSRAMLLLQKITEDSADAMGDFARSEQSFANQSKIAQARLKDLAASFGANLLPAATKAMGGIIELIEEVSKNDELFQTLGNTIETMADMVIDVLPVFLQMVEVISPVMGTIMELVSAIINALKPAFEQIVKIVDIVSPLLDKLLKTVMPLVDIFGSVFATALEIVVGLLEQLAPVFDLILDILGPLFEALKPIVYILGEVLKPIIELITLPLRMLAETITMVTEAVNEALHPWQMLAKANEEAIEGLEKTRKEYEKMEAAIKSGSAKNSELLQTQIELIEKFPELEGAIDLVNGSYEDNVKAINQAILARKEEQVELLKQVEIEIAANLKRAESFKWAYEVSRVLSPATAKLWERVEQETKKRLKGMAAEIEIAREQVKEFRAELEQPSLPPIEEPAVVKADPLKEDKDVAKKRLELQRDYYEQLFELRASDREKLEYEYQNAIEEANKLGADLTAIEAFYSERRKQLAEQEAKARKSVFQEMIDKMEDELNKFTNAFSGMVSQISAIWDQSIENRETELDNQFAKDKARIEQSFMNEDEKTAAMEKLDEEYHRKKAELQKEAFIKEKIANVIMATINTAAAVVEALPNIPLAIATGILGAAQVAFIAAQPVPAFQVGGRHSGGLALVGEQGPEIADFGGPAQIYDAEDTKRILGGQEIINNFYGDMNTDIDLERYMQLSGAKYRSTQRFAS